MDAQQTEAMEVLMEFRELIRDSSGSMASIDYGNLSTEKYFLLRELHENYEGEDDVSSVRKFVKDAFGSYPFARIGWDVYEDWDVFMEEIEKVDFIYENGLVGDEDFNVEEVGRPGWIKHCDEKAKTLLDKVIDQIDAFIKAQDFVDKEHGIF